MATQTAQIESLLGVRAPGMLGLARSIEDGLPVTAVDRLAKIVAPTDTSFKFRIVPKATLERRRKTRKLTNAEGNRVARLAKVFGMAASVFGDEAKAQAFMARPHQMLDNQTPLDVALATGPGADAVLNLLGRAAYSGGA